MAITLANMRRICRARFGLEYGTAADPEIADAFLTELINDAHYWAASVAYLYQDDDLTVAISAATSEYSLSATVIRPRDESFRYLLAGGYTRIPVRTYSSLLEQYAAPLESVATATPTALYRWRGSGASQEHRVRLVPTPNATATLIYAADVFPVALAADADLFPLADGLVYQIVPAVCRGMAEFAYSRGRADPQLVALFTEEAKQGVGELARLLSEGIRL